MVQNTYVCNSNCKRHVAIYYSLRPYTHTYAVLQLDIVTRSIFHATHDSCYGKMLYTLRKYMHVTTSQL